MEKFEVDKIEIKKIENSMQDIAIYDKSNNDWYEELKKFEKSIISI